MKPFSAEKFGLLFILCFFVFGCSLMDSLTKKENAPTSGNTNQEYAGQKPNDSADGSRRAPCNNKYHPVKDGSVKNYEMNNPLGKSTAQVVQKYNAGEMSFTEEWNFKGVALKQVWQCTPEGIIAPNYGSAMTTDNSKVEPRHISGVTLPNEDEMQVGKTWTVVYEATSEMPSGMGKSVTRVTVNNKIVSLDDEVKTPAGAFKAAKVEMDLDIATQINGKAIAIPKMKTAAWFAPGIGVVKSGLTGSDAKYGNMTMEYTGGN